MQTLLETSCNAMLVQGVDILTFGQYLQPTPQHLPVKQQVTPDKFEYWRKFGEDVVGFRYDMTLCTMWGKGRRQWELERGS